MLDEQTLLFGLPIHLDDNTFMYQPTLKEMLEKNFTVEKILEPFLILDKSKFEKETDNNNICSFDILFFQIIVGYINCLKENKDITLTNWINSKESDMLIVKKLIEVLKFLMKTDDIILKIPDLTEGMSKRLDDNYILVNKSYKINRDTFDDIKNLICEILDTKIDVEQLVQKTEKSEEMSELDSLFERKKREYEKKYGKKEKKEKNRENLTIFTLVNYIIHYEYTQYNYTSVKELTIYQIKNTFKYYNGQEMYDIDMKYRTSGNFKMDKKSTEHWFYDKSKK